MAVFKPLSAKNAKVRIAAATFTAKKWRVIPKSPKADTTSFESGGFGTAIGTIIEADVQITDADWDGNANPFDNPPNLRPGQTVHLILYLNDLTGPLWDFPNFLVEEAPCDADVRSTLRVSVNGYGNGQFFYPTGNA